MNRTAKRASKPEREVSPQERLLDCIDAALQCARTARRNTQSLNGANFYANKMANLRAEATIAFQRLGPSSVGDTSALAELMQKVFSTDAPPKNRAQAGRDLRFALKTTWARVPADQSHLEESGVFPLVTLNRTKRGYLVSIGKQANGCYKAGWYDGCAVMMRRLLETSIIEAFEAKKIERRIKDTQGDFFQLTGLVNAALAETSWSLPRNVRKKLVDLRDVGHRSAHNRYYVASQPDIDKHAEVYRETVEAFLHLAGLL